MSNSIKMLRERMNSAGISNEAMAKALGIDSSTFYRKLKNGSGVFSIAQAQKMAEILKLSADDAKAIFYFESRNNANAKAKRSTPTKRKEESGMSKELPYVPGEPTIHPGIFRRGASSDRGSGPQVHRPDRLPDHQTPVPLL